MGVAFVWQRNLDSNQEQRSQRPVCYPYTIPPLPLRSYILSQRILFVKWFFKVFCVVRKKIDFIRPSHSLLAVFIDKARMLW